MYSSSSEKILRLLKTRHLLQKKETLIYQGLMTNRIKREGKKIKYTLPSNSSHVRRRDALVNASD